MRDFALIGRWTVVWNGHHRVVGRFLTEPRHECVKGRVVGLGLVTRATHADDRVVEGETGVSAKGLEPRNSTPDFCIATD